MMQAGVENRVESGRIPELDGLRGLAILLVVLCHYVSNVPHGRPHSLVAMVGTTLGLGSSGVDLFFILSGFLIGGILLDYRQSPHYYRTFYLRRFHRIFPLYYLWIALFAVISLNRPEFQLLTPSWVYPAFLQNYFFQHTHMELVWFGVMWSLGVEEQFYLLSPPLIRHAQPGRLWGILLAILAFSFLLRVFFVNFFGHATQQYWGLRAATFWTPSRADDLALGVLVALAWRTEPVKLWIAAHLAYFRCVVIVSTAVVLLTARWLVKPNYFFSSTVGIPLFSALFLSLLVISLTDRKSIVAIALRWRPLRELGKVSYCVYIIHVTVNWMTHEYLRADQPRFDSLRSIAVTVLALGVTMLVAEFSWFLFEHPLIRRGHRYSYQ